MVKIERHKVEGRACQHIMVAGSEELGSGNTSSIALPSEVPGRKLREIHIGGLFSRRYSIHESLRPFDCKSHLIEFWSGVGLTNPKLVKPKLNLA